VVGEGGIEATHDSDLVYRLRAACNYDDTGNYDPLVLGLNTRLKELNALLALQGPTHLEEQLRRRNAIAARFTSDRKPFLRSFSRRSFRRMRGLTKSFPF
jgi:dTDP-4-amino-4,6-dideoxygalactose transaminase